VPQEALPFPAGLEGGIDLCQGRWEDRFEEFVRATADRLLHRKAVHLLRAIRPIDDLAAECAHKDRRMLEVFG
jgi:hypothetical protein